MNIHNRLKRAFRLNTGVRLSAEDVRQLMTDTAIQDVVYEDHEEFIADRNGVPRAPEPAEPPAAGRRNHMTEKEYLQKFVAFFLDATYRTISPQSAIDLFIEKHRQSGNREPTDARWAVDEYGEEGKK